MYVEVQAHAGGQHVLSKRCGACQCQGAISRRSVALGEEKHCVGRVISYGAFIRLNDSRLIYIL